MIQNISPKIRMVQSKKTRKTGTMLKLTAMYIIMAMIKHNLKGNHT